MEAQYIISMATLIFPQQPPFDSFLGEGSPTKNRLQKKVGTLLTSLLAFPTPQTPAIPAPQLPRAAGRRPRVGGLLGGAGHGKWGIGSSATRQRRAPPIGSV